MRDIPFVERIAERALVLQRADGSRIDVTLEIGRPVPVPQYRIPSAQASDTRWNAVAVEARWI